jgi:hypothetical protein
MRFSGVRIVVKLMSKICPAIELFIMILIIVAALFFDVDCQCDNARS